MILNVFDVNRPAFRFAPKQSFDHMIGDGVNLLAFGLRQFGMASVVQRAIGVLQERIGDCHADFLWVEGNHIAVTADDHVLHD